MTMTKLEQFAQALPQQFIGSDLAWLETARSAGVERFNQLGIPTTKDENWKYTNLRALSSKPFSFAGETKLDKVELETLGNDAHQLVFVNGQYQAAHSKIDELPQGAVVCSMQDALQNHADKVQTQFAEMQPEDSNAFASLNNGLFTDGAFLHLPEGVVLDKPVELVFFASGEQTLNMPRNLIVLEANAKATIIERQLSQEESTALSNSATEIRLLDNAACDFYLLQTAQAKARQIGGMWVRQSANSRFSVRTITLGGQLVRNELKVTLSGEGAHTDCIGLFIGKGRQHIDNHTTIRHSAPNCTSREVYKGILDDRARGVFHGRVMVDQDAQQTFAEQENANLLLSRDAEIDTKPQLEIYADDVKCSHGATVGELDAKQIFYLQSRGLDKQSARTLLTYAFAAEVLDEIELDALKTQLGKVIAKNMHIEDID